MSGSGYHLAPNAFLRATLTLGLCAAALTTCRHLDNSLSEAECTGMPDGTTVWTATSRSPTGEWLATGRSQYGGGMGASWSLTSICLRRQSPVQSPPSPVVEFDDRIEYMRLAMAWTSPSHLEIRYGPTRAGDSTKVMYQVSKLGDAEISVRYLANADRQ